MVFYLKLFFELVYNFSYINILFFIFLHKITFSDSFYFSSLTKKLLFEVEIIVVIFFLYKFTC